MNDRGPGSGRRAARTVRVAALPAADAAGLTAALAATGVLASDGAAALAYAAAVLVLASSRHRLRVCLRAADQAGPVVCAALLPFAGAAVLAPGALPAGLSWLTPSLVLSCRVAACAALRAAHRHGLLMESALVVGAGTFGGFVAGLMRDHPELGLVPAGLVDDGLPRPDLAIPSLGPVSELASAATLTGAGRVIICFSSDCRDEDMVTVLRACGKLHADVCVVPRLYEVGMAVPRGCLDEIWGVPLIPLRHVPALARALKRAADIAVASVLTLLAAPAAVAIAAAVLLESGRPVLFRQARVTGDGQVATITKFRTVRARDNGVHGTDGAGSAGTADTPDTRWAVREEDCGPVGRWLRATHFDELPQLVSVLAGRMSLVGPRPERPYFARQFGAGIPRYADRTRMRGGLTGLAQINGLNGDTSVYDRARFDNYYVEYWSTWLDIVILARTLLLVAAAIFRPRNNPQRILPRNNPQRIRPRNNPQRIRPHSNPERIIPDSNPPGTTPQEPAAPPATRTVRAWP